MGQNSWSRLEEGEKETMSHWSLANETLRWFPFLNNSSGGRLPLRELLFWKTYILGWAKSGGHLRGKMRNKWREAQSKSWNSDGDIQRDTWEIRTSGIAG